MRMSILLHARWSLFSCPNLGSQHRIGVSTQVFLHSLGYILHRVSQSENLVLCWNKSTILFMCSVQEYCSSFIVQVKNPIHYSSHSLHVGDSVDTTTYADCTVHANPPSVSQYYASLNQRCLSEIHNIKTLNLKSASTNKRVVLDVLPCVKATG